MMKQQHARCPKVRGQAAVETLVTIGMILVFVIPILLVLLVGAQARFESLSHVQSNSAINIIADSINEVYMEGPSASKVVMVNLPSNTKNLTIANNEVTLTLETRSGPTDMSTPYFGVVANEGEVFTGHPSNPQPPKGLYPIKFEVDSQGQVGIIHG